MYSLLVTTTYNEKLNCGNGASVSSSLAVNKLDFDTQQEADVAFDVMAKTDSHYTGIYSGRLVEKLY